MEVGHSTSDGWDILNERINRFIHQLLWRSMPLVKIPRVTGQVHVQLLVYWHISTRLQELPQS